MNLNDLANLGQIIGAIAVVISLFYVGHQIRQNTNAVRSATAQAVHEHFASWYHLLANDAELSQVAVNGLRGYLFGEEFRRHVEDDLMKRTPHPDAKPLGAFPIGKPAK